MKWGRGVGGEEMGRHNQCFESGIRIRMGSGFYQVSGYVSGSRRQKLTNKGEKITKFHVLKCWVFSFEG
jgi:hypothetical protein